MKWDAAPEDTSGLDVAICDQCGAPVLQLYWPAHERFHENFDAVLNAVALHGEQEVVAALLTLWEGTAEAA